MLTSHARLMNAGLLIGLVACADCGSAGTVKIADLTIRQVRGASLHLAGDGRITISGRDGEQLIGTLRADGRLTSSDGKLLATLTSNGAILAGQDRLAADARVKDDGALVRGDGRRFAIDSRGYFVGDIAWAATPIQVFGAHDAVARRTAVFLLCVLTATLSLAAP